MIEQVCEPPDPPRLFFVIDPAAFCPLNLFVRYMDETVACMKPAPGFDEAPVPGEPEFRTSRRRQRTGISIDHATLHGMRAHGRRLGLTSIVRIPNFDLGRIKGLIDYGAVEIFLPRADSAKQVAEFISGCRCPPMGSRGGNPRRPIHCGQLDQQAYLRQANRDHFVFAQVETYQLVEVLRLEGLGAGPEFARVFIDCGA